MGVLNGPKKVWDPALSYFVEELLV